MSLASGKEIATNPKRIATLLKYLIHGRAGLTIWLPATEKTYTSQLIEVDPTNNIIKLDEFVPRIDPSVFRSDDRMSVYRSINGTNTQFETRFSKVGKLDGYEYVICHLPEMVTYEQKRQSYRLMSFGGTPPAIKLSLPEKETKAKVLDLSIGGAKVMVNECKSLQIGDILPTSTVYFPDGTEYHTDAEIRSINHHIRTLGLQFLSLNDTEQRFFREWIMNTDRRNLRRRYLSDRSTAMT